MACYSDRPIALCAERISTSRPTVPLRGARVLVAACAIYNRFVPYFGGF
jgi:hypothetical protein